MEYKYQIYCLAAYNMEETGTPEPPMFVIISQQDGSFFMYKTEISMQNVVHMMKKYMSHIQSAQ